MTGKKTYFIYLFQNDGIVNNYTVKKSMIVVAFLSALMISTSITFGSADAQLNFDDFMKQTQENIQSTIENSENSNNNCDNNISIQSQTNENGKTTSTTRSTCDGETSTNTIGSGGLENGNLNGNIVSSEYNLETGDVVNSIYGNWSLTTQDNGSKNFNASFVKQPIYLNTSEASNTVNGTATVNDTSSNNIVTNTTAYDLSNFVGNSVQQQNNDVTYSGKIDVVKETSSNNATTSDETSNYNGIGVSLTLIDNRVLFINFDTQSPLSEEFINTPIVGIVR